MYMNCQSKKIYFRSLKVHVQDPECQERRCPYRWNRVLTSEMRVSLRSRKGQIIERYVGG